jgi:hypothetical protein
LTFGTCLGCEPLTGTATEFGKVMADEMEKWGKVVTLSSATVE